MSDEKDLEATPDASKTPERPKLVQQYKECGWTLAQPDHRIYLRGSRIIINPWPPPVTMFLPDTGRYATETPGTEQGDRATYFRI